MVSALMARTSIACASSAWL